MKSNFSNFNAESWIKGEKENRFPAGWVVVWSKDFTRYECLSHGAVVGRSETEAPYMGMVFAEFKQNVNL